MFFILQITVLLPISLLHTPHTHMRICIFRRPIPPLSKSGGHCTIEETTMTRRATRAFWGDNAPYHWLVRPVPMVTPHGQTRGYRQAPSHTFPLGAQVTSVPVPTGMS